MKRYLGILLVLVFANLAFSQYHYLRWQKNYGGTAYERTGFILKTSDRGYILVGQSESSDIDLDTNRGVGDYWIVKLDSAGQIQWQRSFGGTQDDFATSVRQTPDGGYYIVGYSWSRDGDVIVDYGCYNIWNIKLDSGGNVVWFNPVQGSGCEQAYDMELLDDGTFVIAGYSESTDGDFGPSNGYEDYILVKLDTRGNVLWVKQYGGSADDEAFAMAKSPRGFVLAGVTKSGDGDVTGYRGNGDVWIVATDEDGNMLWQKTYGGTSLDKANDIVVTADGGCLVAGLTYSADGDVSGYHNYGDFWIVRLDASGDFVWQKTVGGSGYDEAKRILPLNDGTYIVVGTTMSSDGDFPQNYGGRDYAIVHIDDNGQILGVLTMGGSGDDIATAAALDYDGSLLVLGFAASNDDWVDTTYGGADFWLVRLAGSFYTPVDGAPDVSLAVYPNPAMDYVVVRANNVIKKIELWSIDGKKVLTGSPDSEVADLYLGKFAPGSYLLRVFTAEGVAVKRLLLNK